MQRHWKLLASVYSFQPHARNPPEPGLKLPNKLVAASGIEPLTYGL